MNSIKTLQAKFNSFNEAYECIAELSEEVFFKVLQELSLDDFKSGFIKLDDDGLGCTENTEKGQELYFAIESVIENFFSEVKP